MPQPTPTPVTPPAPELIPVPDVGPVKPVDTVPVAGPTVGGETPSEVPEPETLALMVAGLGLVAWTRRRMSRK